MSDGEWKIRLSPTTLSIPYQPFPRVDGNAWAGRDGPDMEVPVLDWNGWVRVWDRRRRVYGWPERGPLRPWGPLTP